MKDKMIPTLIVLGHSMFCGFIVIATGLGTLTSPLNRIAGPMLCGARTLEMEKDSSAYIQGEQTHNVTAYCVEPASGEKQEVSVELMGAITKLQIATGFFSGLIFFALAMVFLNWAARRLGKSFSELFQPSAR
jgi:hypothetical protein